MAGFLRLPDGLAESSRRAPFEPHTGQPRSQQQPHFTPGGSSPPAAAAQICRGGSTPRPLQQLCFTIRMGLDKNDSKFQVLVMFL